MSATLKERGEKRCRSKQCVVIPWHESRKSEPGPRTCGDLGFDGVATRLTRHIEPEGPDVVVRED